MELRPLREADLAPLAAWLPRAATELGCERWATENALRQAVGREEVLVAVERELVALLAYEAGAPRGDAARVRLLAVAPGLRRLGIGSRAALALEERLLRSVERVYALVPARLGLAFYFWLRLGYRPLTQREWPIQPEDPPAVWMARELRERRQLVKG